MIIQINGWYFNPLQITMIQQDGADTLVWFATGNDECLRFKGWKVQNLADEINTRIIQFERSK